MKTEELKQMSPDDLNVKLASLKEELSKLQYLKRAGQF